MADSWRSQPALLRPTQQADAGSRSKVRRLFLRLNLRCGLIGLLVVALVALSVYLSRPRQTLGNIALDRKDARWGGISQTPARDSDLLLTNTLRPTRMVDPALSSNDPRTAQLDVEQCAEHREASAAIEQLAARLPAQHLFPSPSSPFVFLHNRKCGGSTMRQLVAYAAAANKLTAMIPCFPPVTECNRYNMRQVEPWFLNNVSIAAGHLSWDAMEDIGLHKNISCYFMMRDPVDMFASYFYHRHPLAVRDKKRLADVSPAELRLLLNQSSFQASWEWWELGGPANSATRMLSGADITGHMIGPDATEYVERRKGIPLDVDVAKRNLDRCVVGLLSDMPTTYRALEYWFPWLPENRSVENVNSERPRNEGLPDGIKKVVMEYMSLDAELYEYGLERFQMQKELLEAVTRAKEGANCT